MAEAAGNQAVHLEPDQPRDVEGWRSVAGQVCTVLLVPPWWLAMGVCISWDGWTSWRGFNPVVGLLVALAIGVALGIALMIANWIADWIDVGINAIRRRRRAATGAESPRGQGLPLRRSHHGEMP